MDGWGCLHAWLQTANASTYKDRSHILNNRQGDVAGRVGVPSRLAVRSKRMTTCTKMNTDIKGISVTKREWLARTMYMRCIYDVFGREFTKNTV